MIRGLVTSLLVLHAALAGAATGVGQPALYPDNDIDTGARPLKALAFSADGRLLAAGGPDGSVTVLDAQAGRPLGRHQAATAAVSALAFDPAAATLAVGAADGTVAVIDLRTGDTRPVLRHDKSVTAVAFAAEGALAGSGDAGGAIALWEPARGAVVGRLTDEGHRQPILSLAFPSEGMALSVGRDLKVIAWDSRSRRALRRGTLQSETFGRAVDGWAAGVDSSGATLGVAAQLVTASHSAFFGSGPARPSDMKRANVIFPYAVQTGVAGQPVRLGDARADVLAVAPGGCFAFVGGAGGGGPELHLWSLRGTGQDVQQVALPARPAALALDAGGRRLAAGLESGHVLLWSVSGAGAADCEALQQRGAPQGQARVALGAETEPLVPAAAGFRIAVLGFEAGGVEPHVADAVREMLQGELANSPHVQVIERAAIDAVLREMEIQRSGLTAADAVRIGRGLNARKVLFGSVRRFGDRTFVVLARVVDVETQQVQGSRQVTCESCAEGDLPRAVQALRQAIVP
jgi:TolB-like protein